MSEIQDAAQIIKVSFEGAEIILKMGNTGWQFVKDICAVFKKVLDQEKLSINFQTYIFPFRSLARTAVEFAYGLSDAPKLRIIRMTFEASFVGKG